MLEFYAEKPIWTDSLELYCKETHDAEMFAVVAAGIEIKKMEKGQLWPKFLSFSMMSGAGQSLFDALWNVGYRPNKGESSMAHVEAMKYHLEDMRTLVFKRRK